MEMFRIESILFCFHFILFKGGVTQLELLVGFQLVSIIILCNEL